MLKYPPLSLSSSLQKIEGESKSGLGRSACLLEVAQEVQWRVGACGRGKHSLPAHEVNAPVYAYEGTCMHIPNQPIVLNW
jgi:hypothetical protein